MSTAVGNVNYNKIEKWTGSGYGSAAGVPAAPVVDIREQWVNQCATPIYTASQVPIGVVVPTDFTFNNALKRCEINATPGANRDLVFTLYPPGLQAQPSPATFLGVASEKVLIRFRGELSAGTFQTLLGATSVQNWTAAQWNAALAGNGYVEAAFTVVGAPTTLTVRAVSGTLTTGNISAVMIQRYSDRFKDYFTANTGLCT